MTALTVMTRNLYVGSEFEPVTAASTLEEALAAVPAVHREILESDFPGRAERIADEIVEVAPDLIGLQEAVSLRSGPLDGGEPTEVDREYLVLLLAALERRGSEYEAVAQVWNIDTTMPSGFPPTKKLRLTDRDVLLARPGIAVRDSATGTFDARGGLDIGAGSVPLTRGWISAEVELGDASIVIVTTHLETSQFPDVQLSQANELLAGVLDTDRPVVLIGDLNAQAPDAPAYRLLLEAGLHDAWTTANGNDPGLTCCQEADLRNAESKLYERIDLVMLRGPFDVTSVRRTGYTPAARTPSGVWPSDHAGVVATIGLRAE
jgi:endonuclease/exonuclease/phosphatase family metal-dependent hydrolase